MKTYFKSSAAAIAFLVFLNIMFWYFGFAVGKIYIKDSYEYLYQVENIKAGNSWYSGDIRQRFIMELVSQRPPMYAAFLFVIKSLTPNDHFALLIQCFFGVLNFYLILKLLGELGIKIAYPILLFLPLIFFPTQMIYTNMIMSELLCQVTITLAFYFIILFLIKHKIRDLLFFHICIALAILTKPVWYLFWIPIAIFMGYLLWKKRIKIIHTLFVLIPVGVVFFVCLHNYNQTGYFHYSSIKRTNMANYNVYLTLMQNHSPAEADKILDDVYKAAGTKDNYKQYSEYIEAGNSRIIRENLPAYLWLETKGVFNFFVDHGRFDMYCFFAEPTTENMNGATYYFSRDGIKGMQDYLSQFPLGLLIYLPIITLVNLLIALCFLLFLFNNKVSFEVRITALIFILYLALITGPIGASRFRMPVYPILLFTLPLGIATMKRIITRNK